MLIAYVLGHLIGNLQIFLDPSRINHYAKFLHSLASRSVGNPRLPAGLLRSAHCDDHRALACRIRAARPKKHIRMRSRPGNSRLAHDGAQRTHRAELCDLSSAPFYRARKTDFFNSPLAEGGLLREGGGHTMNDPPPSTIPWSRAFPRRFLLSLHLSHGFSSVLQTLGLNSSKTSALIETGGRCLAWAIFAGYASIPGRSAQVSKNSHGLYRLNSNIPAGPLAQKWEKHKIPNQAHQPGEQAEIQDHRRGRGAGGRVGVGHARGTRLRGSQFCFPRFSPRRAHSIAAQGGINAAKNYQNDGDSVHRLFYDTIKGGDFRSREANVHRLAEVSVNIIDQCAAQGVPFAREYGGLLDNRSFGGAQVSRTFYARGQTGQQLLLGAYSALNKMIGAGGVKSYTHSEMLDLVVVDGHAKGIIVRNLQTGEITRHNADAVVLATGGYGNVFNLSTYARGSNATAIWRAYKRGACFANPCYTQIHPTCIPVSGDYQSKLTLMSESLRNDGRVWVPKKRDDKESPANSRGRARLLSRTDVFRASAISPRATSPRAPRNRLR